MKILAITVVLALLGSSFANKAICPHPEEADLEVASERISLDAPLQGHAAVELDLSTRVLGRELACFTLVTESQNTGPHIVSLGKNFRGGFSVKIFTEERRGLNAFLQAYTPPSPNPNPQPSPQPNPDPNPQPNPDPNPQPNPDPNPQPNPDPNPQPNPDPNPQPNPDPNPQPNPQPDPQPFPPTPQY